MRWVHSAAMSADGPPKPSYSAQFVHDPNFESAKKRLVVGKRDASLCETGLTFSTMRVGGTQRGFDVSELEMPQLVVDDMGAHRVSRMLLFTCVFLGALTGLTHPALSPTAILDHKLRLLRKCLIHRIHFGLECVGNIV